jgi:DNA-directed RNA polymerase specialized sigma24 family protein
LKNIDLSRTEWENLINEWIFSERDRNIIKRRLLDGLTYKELQDEFNLSIDRLKRIIYKGQNKIFKHI